LIFFWSNGTVNKKLKVVSRFEDINAVNMSYSTLKKALQLFEEQPPLNQKTTQKKSGNF